MYTVSRTFATAAEASAFILGNSTVAAAPAAVVRTASELLGDKVRAFLEGDESNFDWRSADAIAKAISSDAASVAECAREANGLQRKNSTGNLGVLISLS